MFSPLLSKSFKLPFKLRSYSHKFEDTPQHCLSALKSELQTNVIIDEREFPNLGEVKRSPPPNPAASMSSSKSSKSKSATAESSKANSEAGSVDAAGE